MPSWVEAETAGNRSVVFGSGLPAHDHNKGAGTWHNSVALVTPSAPPSFHWSGQCDSKRVYNAPVEDVGESLLCFPPYLARRVLGRCLLFTARSALEIAVLWHSHYDVAKERS